MTALIPVLSRAAGPALPVLALMWLVSAPQANAQASAARSQPAPPPPVQTTPAQTAPVVIELYTSQGCSYCPPADALLVDLARHPDVLPLAFHVDYWDYIGWADTFGRPEFTERQKDYARAAGHRTISTPQMVIDGSDFVLGTRPLEVAELVARHLAARPASTISLSEAAGTLKVSLSPAEGLHGPLAVLLVRYLPEQQVMIGHGENAGRRIVYANVVTGLEQIGEWSGAGPLEIETPVAGEGALAVIAQEAGMGPIAGAAVLDAAPAVSTAATVAAQTSLP